MLDTLLKHILILHLSFLLTSCLDHIEEPDLSIADKPKETYVFLGRKGVGKTTIINSIIGKRVCLSTDINSFNTYKDNEKQYIDTPDINLNNIDFFAKKINKVTQKSNYKIFFIMNPTDNFNNSHIDPLDLQVMEDLNKKINIPTFNVIVNKLKPSSNILHIPKGLIAYKLKVSPPENVIISKTHFLHLDEELTSGKSKLLTIDNNFKNFLSSTTLFKAKKS